MHVALGMLRVVRIQRLLPHAVDLIDFAQEQVGRREQGDALVRSMVVVVLHETPRPASGMLVILEAAGIVRRVLEGLELALAEGVVVAGARSRMAALDTQAAQQFGKGVCGHRRAAILMHDQRFFGDGVRTEYALEQMLGKPRILLAADCVFRPIVTGDFAKA